MFLIETIAATDLTATAIRVGMGLSFDDFRSAHSIHQTDTSSSDGDPIFRTTPDIPDIYLGQPMFIALAETDKKNIMDEFRQMLSELNSEDSRLPTNQVSTRTADLVLMSRAINLTPDRIGISSEGGAIVQFVREHAYADVEMFNCGGVLAVVKLNGKDPEIWEPDWNEASEIEETLVRIEKALSLHGSN